MIAFDRLLARLQASDPSAWLLKGGYALQLRFGDRSRTTKDLDLLLQEVGEISWAMLRRAAEVNLGDWFEFEVARPVRAPEEDQPGSQRFPVRSLLDGRRFEDFHIDVGTGDPIVEAPEILETPGLLEFAGIVPVRVPTYPLTQQIAEKLHAYTRPYGRAQNTRVRDFVDMLLIASVVRLDAANLWKAIQATFEARSTHLIPKELPAPPTRWSASFLKLIDELELGQDDLDQGSRAARSFLNPILTGSDTGTWNPLNWAWEQEKAPGERHDITTLKLG